MFYSIYQKLGGFDSTLISGEDWDLSNRARPLGKISRIKSLIQNHDGTITLVKTFKKKFYYGKNISKFTKKESSKEVSSNQLSLLARYKMFLSKPKTLFSNPVVGIGLLFLKTSEFLAIASGIVYSDPKEALRLVSENIKNIFSLPKFLKKV